MNLLEYSNSIVKIIDGDSDLYLDSLIRKIQGKLRNMEIPSEITNEKIIFKRFVEGSKRDAMKILREGQIRIKKISSNKVEIFWQVKLDSLLFLSIVTGFVAGFVFGLLFGTVGLMLIASIIVGLVISTIAYLFGLNFILITIDEILETSI